MCLSIHKYFKHILILVLPFTLEQCVVVWMTDSMASLFTTQFNYPWKVSLISKDSWGLSYLLTLICKFFHM